MEHTPNPSETPKHLISYDESFAHAKVLHDQYHDQLVVAENKDFGKSTMIDCLGKIPDEIKRRFNGHGIKRGGKYGTEADKLAAFINILENETIIGDSGPIGGGQLGAYTNVDFLILSPKDTPLLSRDSKRNDIGLEAHIGAFVVGNRYYPIVEELKKRYPNRNIIRADELGDFMLAGQENS